MCMPADLMNIISEPCSVADVVHIFELVPDLEVKSTCCLSLVCGKPIVDLFKFNTYIVISICTIN